MTTDAQLEPSARKPMRPWQFSLRTALVLMLVVGAGLGLWARQERIRRNRLALIEKYAASGEFVFESAFQEQSGRRLHVLVFSWDAGGVPGPPLGGLSSLRAIILRSVLATS